MTRQELTSEEAVWKLLDEVKDPEIPLLSILDMGVVRSVEVIDHAVAIVITPTFVGCPALEAMQRDINRRVTDAGFAKVTVTISFDLPWSTDMLSEKARDRLRTMGIAPPPSPADRATAHKDVDCPYCASTDVALESSFGPTLCKQIFYCHSCRQSFERMKPL